MKNIMKKVSLVSLVLLFVFAATACGKEKKTAEYNPDTVNNITKNVITLMRQSVNPEMADSIAEADEDDLEGLENEIGQMGLGIKGKAFQSGYASYISAVKGDLGEIVSIAENAEITADEDTIISDLIVTGTKTFPDGTPRTATVDVILNKHGVVTSVAFNVNRTFSEKIENAALNTVLGMGTTFCLLIFISIVIWIMGIIVQGMQNKKSATKAEKEAAVENVAKQIAEREEQGNKDLSGDAALVAVISAAIAAYESDNAGYAVSPDTFIVRSLKRR